jgi:hypothetical protein
VSEQLPEHLQRQVPFLLAHLKDGPRDARWLGWARSGLEAVAEAGLITIDSQLDVDDPFVVRLPGDRRSWVGWRL